MKLVYGGGTKGIMGEIARTVVKLNGPDAVHGIIPRPLVRVEEGYNKDKNGDRENEGGVGEEENGVGGKTAERVVSNSDTNGTEEFGRTTVVPDMHTRKRMMAAEVINGGPGSGFVVLPGGFGTLEEAMEMITWNQLSIHHRGIVFVNVEGYYEGVFEWVRKAVREEFVDQCNEHILAKCDDAEDVLGVLDRYKVAQGRMALDWTLKDA